MALEIPDYYFEEKFRQYAKDVTINSSGVMNGGCPMCMEGNSWGRKRRLFYYPESKFATCFNCGESISQINFILKFDGIEFKELAQQLSGELVDNHEYNKFNQTEIGINYEREIKEIKLPFDSIDLMDETQTEFYKDEWAVKKALKTIKERRLDTAKYRSKLYLSLSDFTHKNRIIIPFRNEDGDLEFFQSRAQTKTHEEMAKYLSSLDGRKNFFGLDGLDPHRPFIFVLEGPLDCFFVPNSIGGGGIKLNKDQTTKIQNLNMFYNNGVVFCYDNDFDNSDVVDAYLRTIADGYKVFLWGGQFSKYKDFNEYAVDKGVDQINELDILKQCKSGMEATKIVLQKSGRDLTSPSALNRVSSFDDCRMD